MPRKSTRPITGVDIHTLHDQGLISDETFRNLYNEYYYNKNKLDKVARIHVEIFYADR